MTAAGEGRSKWPAVQLRRFFEIINGGTPQAAPENWDGDIAWVTPEDLSGNQFWIERSRRTISNIGVAGSSATVVPHGSIVVSTRAPIGYVALARMALATNQGCRALIPSPSIDSRYFAYQLMVAKPVLDSLGAGSTFRELSSESLATFRVLVPSPAEQRTISNFLDAETARIDQVIQKRRTMVARLLEFENGLIDRIVWSVSGVLTPLMHLTKVSRPIMYGIVLPGPDVSDGVLLVKGGDVEAGRLAPGALARTAFDVEAPFARARLIANDIVFSIRGSVGAAAMVPALLEGANITQDVARISPAHGLDPRWLMYAVKSHRLQAQVRARVTGATIRGVNIWDLKRCAVPVPSSWVQSDVAAELDRRLVHISGLRRAIDTQVIRLLERRAAIIAAAVTGQIDIPDS